MRKTVLTLTLTALLAPAVVQAQVREVVSKQVAVGQSEAVLLLEFADDGRLEISFEDGTVLVNDDAVGSFEPGGALDAAWRSLLGEAVALDDGPLAQRLRDWSPPESLDQEAFRVAQAIDGQLEAELSLPAQSVAEAEEGVSVRIGGGTERALVRTLLSQASRLGLLEEALRGLDENFSIHIDEDVEVAEGETVEGTLLVIEANARVSGTVNGDVVVVDGGLELLPGSRVTGEVRLADARLLRDEGSVEGGVVDVLDEEGVSDYDEREVRDRIRNELRTELRNELRSELRDVTRGRDGGASLFRPFVAVTRAVGGIMENLLIVFVLGLLGAGVAAFAGGNLDAVAETARRSPGRSAMVGMAGSFLLIPVWILGIVALAVSIIGIPVMVAWIPLFPLAAGAAAILGYLAVARNAGEWLAGTNYRYTDWIRKSNPVYTIFGGLLGLMAFFIVADILSIVPFFEFLQGLLTFVGVMLSLVAVQVGFGAVLLTRFGRRPEYYDGFDAEAAWEASAAAEGADRDL